MNDKKDLKSKPQDDHQKCESCETEITEWEKKAGEYLAGWQRARADFDNYKKDEGKRRQEMAEFVNAAFMAEVLPIYGQLKVAFKHVPLDQEKLSWVVGLKHIQKQFGEFLRKYKIEEIKTVGEKFDPNLHEAVAYELKDGFAEGIIFEEMSTGYLLDGKVLAPAKVKVAK